MAWSLHLGTVTLVGNRELLARLLTTPWLSSFVGRARGGDLLTSDLPLRCAAWSHWAVESLEEYQGGADRKYVGIELPGSFHAPKFGATPDVSPHLEIPSRVLSSPDPLFPERLALAGNTLMFRWWVAGEVIAARRVIFAPGGDISPLVDSLSGIASALCVANATLSQALADEGPAALESLGAERLADELSADFPTPQIESLIPFARDLSLQVDFDPKLRQANGPFISRRVGVWVVKGSSPASGEFSLGVVTPRFASSSPVSEGISPQVESPAALLVRCLVLRRLAFALGLGNPVSQLVPAAQAGPRPFLRAIVAKPGGKVPEASEDAAVHFLHTFPEVDPAWQALQQWAGEEYLLTVSLESFTAAHLSARRFLRRGEMPLRDDINAILPLAWDSRSRVVRATFSRPGEDAPVA